MPLTSPQSALIGTAINTASGIFGYLGAKRQQERQFSANKAQSELAYKRYLKDTKDKHKLDLQQWMRQNAYNDPSQQMARLKAAGLNPNLVYGTGTVAGNVTSSAPPKEAAKYQAAQASYSQPSLGTAQTVMQHAQVQNIHANTESIRLNNQKLKIDLGATSFIEVDTKTLGNQTVVNVKVANRYAYKKDLELQQSKAKLDNTQLEKQVKQMAARLSHFNISVSDKLVIKQLVLNMQGTNLNQVEKQALLLAIAALSK